jgi:hypothetical protein
MAFLEVNGVELPCPSLGLEIILSDAVNSGRNANAEVIAEKVGKTNLKYNNLMWKWLTPDEWHLICDLFSNFFVTAKVWSPLENDFVTLKMYPGDRSAQVYWLDDDHTTPKNFMDCKVNIIDCGLVSKSYERS